MSDHPDLNDIAPEPENDPQDDYRKFVTCWECNGDGIAPASGETCWRCHGNGEVLEP